MWRSHTQTSALTPFWPVAIRRPDWLTAMHVTSLSWPRRNACWPAVSSGAETTLEPAR